MAVTFSDSCSPHPNKLSRFVGICIDRGGCGLRAWFIVRNIIEGQGVEFMYQMYRYRDTAAGNDIVLTLYFQSDSHEDRGAQIRKEIRR